MKRIYLLLLIAVLGSVAFGQSNTQLKKKCPGSSTYATVIINNNGDIVTTPCVNRTAIVKGKNFQPAQVAVLQTDFPKTNNTLTVIPELTLNVTAGHWYRITGLLDISNDGGTGGMKFDFAGGTATTTGVAGLVFGYDDGNDAVHGATITALNTVNAFGTTGRIPFNINFTIQVNAGGTLIPQFAQLSTDATASVVNKYSVIQATDVTPGL